MIQTTFDQQLTEVYALMNKEDIALAYSGIFNQTVVKSMLRYTENKFHESTISDLVKKKIFNVMTEMLQNISKHQSDGDKPAVFILCEGKNSFQLITGNYIGNDFPAEITSKIDIVNKMSKEELKEYYKQMRIQSTISDAGGAGLGFIDIVRKSENPLEYEFINDNTLTFFVLKATINNSLTQ